MIHVESTGSGCKIEANGTGKELLAEWCSITEAMFDSLIEKTSVGFAKHMMENCYKMAREASIRNHSDDIAEENIFESMGLPGLGKLYREWEAEQES